MPLFPKKHDKAGMKPKDKSLAIAISVKHKPKKMAQGGEVKDSAKQESRPMPEEVAKDSKQVSHNSGNKAPHNDKVTSQPERKQAGQGKIFPLKHPKMASSDIVQSRLRDQEDDLQSSADVNGGPQEQPPEHDNEEGAKRKGPSVPSLHMKMMADGGPIDPKGVAAGARQGGSLSDAFDGIMHPKWAEGGEITDRANELDSQEPIHEQHYSSEEEALDHASSIVAGVMAHRRKMAEGGQVDIESNNMEQPNAYYDANEAALKENPDSEFKFMSQLEDSNEDGREISADPHEKDMLSEIRAKMKRRLK